MTQLLLTICLFISLSTKAQKNDYFIFKKKHKVLRTFRVGSLINFCIGKNQFRQGYIKTIQNDSFFIRPEIVRYNLFTTDTIRFPIERYAITDITAMPEKGLQIDFINGRWWPRGNAGHIHFYWIKSGYLLKRITLGLSGLRFTNELIEGNNPLQKQYTSFYITNVALFGIGMLLKKFYRYVLPLGKKFSIVYVRIL